MINSSPPFNGLKIRIPNIILIKGRRLFIRGLHWEGLGIVFELSGFFVGSTASGPPQLQECMEDGLWQGSVRNKNPNARSLPATIQSQNEGCLIGVPIIRIKLFLVYAGVPLILGNSHLKPKPLTFELTPYALRLLIDSPLDPLKGEASHAELHEP